MPHGIPEEKLDESKKIIHVYGSMHLDAHKALSIEMCKALYGWMEDGSIKGSRVEVLPGGLSAIPDGLGRLERGETGGFKLVAHPQD